MKEPNGIVTIQMKRLKEIRILNMEPTTTSTDTPTDPQSSDEEDERRQPIWRNLQDLYDSTNEVHRVCLLADAENISPEEAMSDEKWQATMDEEIHAIERNKTWELKELLKVDNPSQ